MHFSLKSQSITNCALHAGLAEEERDKFLGEVILALQDRLISNWFTFGLNLDLNVTELNILEINSFGYADKRTSVRRMLTKWKDKFGKEATWDKIFDALRKSGENSLVQDLEAKHLRSAEQRKRKKQQKKEKQRKTKQKKEKERNKVKEPGIATYSAELHACFY